MDVEEDGDSRSNQGVTAVTVPKGENSDKFNFFSALWRVNFAQNKPVPNGENIW